MKFFPTPVPTDPVSLVPLIVTDSGPIACPLGVYTQLIAVIPDNGLWFELRIQVAGGAGNLRVAEGPAGLEVDVFHQNYGGAFNGDLVNVPFHFTPGARLSVNPSTNLTAAEAHIYHR